MYPAATLFSDGAGTPGADVLSEQRLQAEGGFAATVAREEELAGNATVVIANINAASALLVRALLHAAAGQEWPQGLLPLSVCHSVRAS